MDGWELASDCYYGRDVSAISICIHTTKISFKTEDDVLYGVVILVLHVRDSSSKCQA